MARQPIVASEVHETVIASFSYLRPIPAEKRQDSHTSLPMPASDSNLPSGRKRRRQASADQPLVDTQLPPWKRAKKPFRSQREAETAFWDSLSKLWLTRRALREFNRRNDAAAKAGHYQLDNTRAPSIKRFARHGGPDLGDLRGVWMMYIEELLN